VISGELGARIRNDLISLDRAEPLIRLGRALSLLGGVGAALQTPCTDIRAVGRLVSSDGAGNSDRQKRVDRLLLFIRRHLHRPIQAQEAARRLHVTPGAFSRAFKRLIGKSFSQYVNDLRVAEACLELGRSDRPVAQIATQCGFGTLSNFNRQFRARLGVTPRAYRSGSARK
jgi:AraC-like DNA-binding protein